MPIIQERPAIEKSSEADNSIQDEQRGTQQSADVQMTDAVPQNSGDNNVDMNVEEKSEEAVMT